MAEQEISELIDNSIDARSRDATEHIYVVLDFEGKAISVADDGTGMDADDLRRTDGRKVCQIRE